MSDLRLIYQSFYYSFISKKRKMHYIENVIVKFIRVSKPRSGGSKPPSSRGLNLTLIEETFFL